MKTYWVSWYEPPEFAGYELPPLTWVSGWGGENLDHTTLVSCIDAESEDDVWSVIHDVYNSIPLWLEVRFCEEKELGWRPWHVTDRFPKPEGYDE